jgi:hypothetical protein
MIIPLVGQRVFGLSCNTVAIYFQHRLLLGISTAMENVSPDFAGRDGAFGRIYNAGVSHASVFNGLIENIGFLTFLLD